MPSSPEYLEYVLDLLRDAPDIAYRKMMGEYVLYCEDVVFGGIYDDRFLLKNVEASRAEFPEQQLPYDGGSPMQVCYSENPKIIAGTIAAMLPQLPRPKAKSSPKIAPKAPSPVQ